MSVTNSLAPVSQWQWSSPIQLGGIFTNHPNEDFFDGKITSCGGTNYMAYLAMGQIGIAYQTDVGFANDWTTTATTPGYANPSILPNPQNNGWLMSYVPGALYGYGYALDANAYAPNSNAWTFVGTADTNELACGIGGGPVEIIPNSAAKTRIWAAVQGSTIFNIANHFPLWTQGVVYNGDSPTFSFVTVGGNATIKGSATISGNANISPRRDREHRRGELW
jgi:hypothetical protein